MLDLALDALGWLGRIALNRGRPARALGHYARQAADGEDPNAVQSMIRAAEALTQAGPEHLAEAAANPLSRRAFTAYLIAYPQYLAEVPDWPRRWSQAGEEPLAEATLRARGAYMAGRFEAARRWLEAAPPDDPVVLWLRGKLDVRDGRLGQAAETLRRAALRLKEDPAGIRFTWWMDHPAKLPVAREVLAWAGVAELSRGRFEEALETFVQADDEADAYYVAEWVLTADKLRRWIDREVPSFGDHLPNTWNLSLDLRLRWLLARRLVRLDRIDEALPYFPPQPQRGSRPTIRALAERLREALVCGRGEAVGRECHGADRADGYWQAALITRFNGGELRGAVLLPDYELERRRGFRFLPPTDEEVERVARHDFKTRQRWNLRYLAADLAWKAAELLADRSDRKATILATAGTWLKHRDPEAADRYYKALVRCCRNTELGHRAEELRWFPPVASPISP